MRYPRNPGVYTILVIIGINLLFYIAIIAIPMLFSLFALRPAYFLQMPWTILTSFFMHAGVWHLIVNMLTLYFLGTALIGLVGEGRFWVVYILGGIVGNALYIALGHPLIPVVGASGAIFALGGALAVMRPRVKVIVFPIPVPVPLWAAILGGFIILSFIPYVAWQAHLGGLIVGLIAGYIFRRQKRRFRYY